MSVILLIEELRGQSYRPLEDIRKDVLITSNQGKRRIMVSAISTRTENHQGLPVRWQSLKAHIISELQL